MLNLKTYLVVFFFITAVSASWFRQLENTSSSSGDSRRSSSTTTGTRRRKKKKTTTTQQRSQRRQAPTHPQQQQEEDRWTEFERHGFYSSNAVDAPLPLTTTTTATTDSRRRKRRSVVVQGQQQQDQSTTTILNKLQNKISTTLMRGFHTYDHLAFQQIKQVDFDQIKTTAGGNGNNIPCHSLDSIDATIDLYSSHISGLDTFVVVANEEETTTSWDLIVKPTSTTTTSSSSSSHLHHHFHPHHRHYSTNSKKKNKKKKNNHEEDKNRDWKATLLITGSFHKIWARLGADVWTNCPELQNTTMTDIKVYLQEPGISLEITVEGTWSQSQLPSSSSSSSSFLIINKASIVNLELTFSSFRTTSYTMDSLDSSGEAIAKSSSSSSSFTTTSSSSSWWAKNLLTRTIEGFVLDGLQTNVEPEIQSGLNIDLGSEFPTTTTTTSMDRGDSSIIISS